jgi:hypothetical protein
MKNKILIIIIVVIMILIIATITLIIYSKQDYSNVTIDTVDIMNNISTSLGSDIPPMMQLDVQQVTDEYNIDILKLESYTIKIPMMNIRADEIAIIKVKNIDDIEYIKGKLKGRLTKIENTFEKYLPDQYELAKSPLIVSKGKYILMSISEKNDEIENIFKSYFTHN